MSTLSTMLTFAPVYPADNQALQTASMIPKEMDIYYRTEENFLPNNKDFKDLSQKEKEELKGRYRFDPLRPGIPQTLSGFEGVI